MSIRRATVAESKPEALARHLMYGIATGKWPAGARLPSLRQAEELWSLNRLTIRAAYARLVGLGLVSCRHGSGYTVVPAGGSSSLPRRRPELVRLYESTAARIRRTRSISPLGAFRWMAQLAETRALEKPECAFVECTAPQAAGHAREINDTLRVPCLPLTTDVLARRGPRLPRHLRLLLTTGFHLGEVRAAGRRSRIPVVSVPIEVDPELISALPPGKTDVVIVETHPDMANHIASDAAAAAGHVRVRSLVAADPSAALATLLGTRKSPKRRRLVLLSPRVWGAVAPRWREHPRVKPLGFRICPTAWPSISDRLGLPLGAFG